ADFLQCLIVPDFYSNACTVRGIMGEAYRAKAIVRTKGNLAILIGDALQSEDVRYKACADAGLADGKADVADRIDQWCRTVIVHRVRAFGCWCSRKILIIRRQTANSSSNHFGSLSQSVRSAMPRTTLSVSATMSAATEAGTPLAASASVQAVSTGRRALREMSRICLRTA